MKSSTSKSLTNKHHIVSSVNSRAKAKRTMSSTDGMSLIEVVVALGLLVVIMFFMSSTQMSSLKLNHKTGIIRELTHNAEREIENRRQIPEKVSVTASSESDCFFGTEVEAKGYSCTTEVHPCSIVNDNVECVDTDLAAFPATEAVAHQIVVDMLGPEEGKDKTRRPLRLQTIVEADKASP